MFESLRRQAGSGSLRESGFAGNGGRRKGYATTLAILLFTATTSWLPQRDAIAETVAGVTAGDITVASSEAAFPQVVEKRGGLRRAKSPLVWGLVCRKNGIALVVEASR